jgi:hypothetical protein
MKNDINLAVFTTHKAGSMFIFEICLEISRIKEIDLYSPNQSKDSEFWLEQKASIENRKGFFAPLRWMRPTHLDCKKILHLRDPRDILTSYYYSHRYSHALINDRVKKRRAHAIEEGVDGHVLRLLKSTKKRFEQYIPLLEDATFLKYEDMVTDFPLWVSSFIEPFEFDDVEDVVSYLIDKYAEEFKVESEDVYRHKRQILPGDHRRKLKPETIEILNSELSDVMRVFGYDL